MKSHTKVAIVGGGIIMRDVIYETATNGVITKHLQISKEKTSTGS